MKSSDSGKNIGCRDQYHKLAHDRYDHTEYCLSKCLEHSTRNNSEPCDQVMDTNDPKCGNTDGKHITGSAEQFQQCFRNEFEGKETDKCKTECNEHADFDSFKHTISMACPIIVGNDRCNTVVKPKYRHEEKTL